MWSRKEHGVFHDIENDEEGKVKRIITIRRGEETRYWPAKFIVRQGMSGGADGKAIYYVDRGTIPSDRYAPASVGVIDPGWHLARPSRSRG
jgi:hypothetical protein